MAADSNNPSDINISKINPAGFAGLGLVVVALGIAWALPGARTFAIMAVVGGVLLSVPLYFWRKNHRGKW